MTLINRNRSDNDPSFQIKISGFCRGEIALLMDVLHDWITQHQAGEHSQERSIANSFLEGLESHVVGNSDGYSINRNGNIPRLCTSLELEAISAARTRHAQKIFEMNERAREYSRAIRKRKKIGSERD